jgi:hypothetical protein
VFGGFCLLLFFAVLFFPFRGWFLMPVFWCLFVRSDCSDSNSALPVGGGFLFGEFDSGSGRTLAACLTHASRTERPFRGCSSGERVSNTWVICPALWDKPGKLGLIPNTPRWLHGWWGKAFAVWDGPAAYQLVGGVMAYQGDDG